MFPFDDVIMVTACMSNHNLSELQWKFGNVSIISSHTHWTCDYLFMPGKLIHVNEKVLVAKSLGSTSSRRRSYIFASDGCQIDVDSVVFSLWDYFGWVFRVGRTLFSEASSGILSLSLFRFWCVFGNLARLLSWRLCHKCCRWMCVWPSCRVIQALSSFPVQRITYKKQAPLVTQ